MVTLVATTTFAHAKESSHVNARSRREQIQQIDSQLLQLLGERVTATRHLADPNKEATIVDATYIQQLLTKSPSSVAPSESSIASLANWIRHAASICHESTGPSNGICYLGPIYSYSYLAAVHHFGLAAELLPVTTIAAVFDEIVRGQADYGMVPIENSTDGRVVDTLGMFAKTDVKICGEVLLPIHHCLLGKCKRSEITEVHSKPQALSQCRNWLAAHVREARLVEVASTALAAQTASTTPGVAAIASREAGVHNDLDVIDSNIEDAQGNTTRFAVIGNGKPEPTGHDKTSMMLQLNHRPGALAKAMQTFQVQDLNLTWIESFPLPNCPNEYLFFIELDGHKADEPVAKAIEQLQSQTLRLAILGSYPKGIVAQ